MDYLPTKDFPPSFHQHLKKALKYNYKANPHPLLSILAIFGAAFAWSIQFHVLIHVIERRCI